MRTLLVFTIIFSVAIASGQQSATPSPDYLPADYHAEIRKATLAPDADKVVSVIGDVPKPKSIPAGEGLTVTKAIEGAGGFNDFANRRKVGLWRPTEGRFFTVDVRAFMENTPGAKDPLLKPGDIVIVIARVIH